MNRLRYATSTQYVCVTYRVYQIIFANFRIKATLPLEKLSVATADVCRTCIIIGSRYGNVEGLEIRLSLAFGREWSAFHCCHCSFYVPIDRAVGVLED